MPDSTALDQIRLFHGELTEIRHDIHAHPEIGFETARTDCCSDVHPYTVHLLLGCIPRARRGLQPGDDIGTVSR
jgi:hypothetical protein